MDKSHVSKRVKSYKHFFDKSHVSKKVVLFASWYVVGGAFFPVYSEYFWYDTSHSPGIKSYNLDHV